MRIKYESKTYSYFFLAILLSVGLLFSSNCVNITLFDNVFSQKIDNASSLNSSLNSINNLQDGSSSSQIKQQQISKKIPLNHYENRQLGVSLKYPSNFLIDESNSNNTLRQISFYPVNVGSVNPENYIQWMDVFVQTLGTAQQQQPLSSLSNSNSLSPLLSANNNNNNNNNFLASYSLNLANNIQQGNADITIVGSSTNTTLSGYPAYKLITTSYIGNSAITDVLISTIVNNTIYSIDYQIPSSSSNYANSLSDASKIIQSFKILSPVSSESTTAEGMAETRQQLSPSSSSASNVISNNKNLNSNLSNSNSALIPLLSSLLSSLKIDDIANNSTNTVNSLKNSISNSLNDALSNPKNVIDKSISGSSSILQNPPPIPLLTSPSDLSSLSSDTVKKTCSIPFVSTLCNEIKNSLDNNNNNINNIGKTNTSSGNSNNLTNNIAGSGNNSSISTGSGNTTINNNNRLSTTTNDLTGSIGKGGNNIGIGNSINNSKLDNTAIPKNNTDNLLVNHDKNNTLVNILNSLLNTNSTNNSSTSFNKSKPLNDILLLENLIKHLNFSSTISPGPLPPQQPISVNSSSSSPNPLPRNTI
jgi:hypothetical protein